MTYAQIRGMSAEDLRAFITSKSPHEAFRIIDAAGHYGFPDAQVLLGQMFLDGFGVARDQIAAFSWFMAAASADHAGAKNMVGRCYEKGWGTPVDAGQAAVWYRSAAAAGLDWAQYNLANLLLHDIGVPRDRRQALHWYLQAAHQGHAKSINLVGRFLEEGWEVVPDPQAALAWYTRSAEAGDFRGQYNVATILLGLGRLAEACEWLRRSVAAGSVDFLSDVGGTLSLQPDPTLREIGRQALARCRSISR